MIQRVEDNDEWLFRGLNPARYFHESVLVPQLQVKKKINITVNIYFIFRTQFYNLLFLSRKRAAVYMGTDDDLGILTKGMIGRCIE